MKRWSYVTALALSLVGGSVLTGCIDNDEPYGIKEIRLATADFLKSKKAAADAEAAQNTAQAEIDKLMAQADLAIKQAEAKIKEAEANKIQAQADSIAAVVNAYIARQQAELNTYISKAEICVKQCELKYQEALYAFEETKRKNAGAANSKLYQAWASAFQAYLDQLSIVNDLTRTYYEKKKDYAMAEIDLSYNKETGKWESNKYDAAIKLQNSVAYLEKQIKAQQDEIAKLDEYINSLNNIKASDLYVLFEKYEGLEKANTEAIAKAEVEKATLAVDNKADYDKVADLQNQVNSYGNKEIAIPAYTWEPDAALKALGLTKPQVIVPERVSYTLSNRRNYDIYTNAYKGQINILKAYILDDNDKAWTSARITEMKRELAANDALLAVAQNNWTMAKNVYADGDVVKADKLPGQTAVKAAVDAYNAAGAASKTLQAALAAANEKEAEAQKAYSAEWEKYYNGNEENPATNATKAWNDAQTAFDNAFNAATEERSKAIAAAQRVKAEADEAAENAVEAARRAVFTAQQKVNEIQNAAAYPNQQKDLEAARTALTNAQAAETTATTKYGEDTSKANNVYNEAVVKANLKAIDAIAAATKVRDEARQAWIKNGAGYAEKDPAYAPVKTAGEAYQKAQEETATASQNFQSAKNKIWSAYYALVGNPSENIAGAIAEQLNAMDIENFNWENPEVVSVNDLYSYINGTSDEFPTAISPIEYKNAKEVYTNAKYLLVYTSAIAYGSLGTNSMNSDNLPWEDSKDNAFLLSQDQITVKTLNDYIAGINPSMNPAGYYQYYANFGLFGDSCYLKNRIDVAQAYIDNRDLLQTATATLDTNLSKIQDTDDAAIAESKDLNNQLADAKKVVAALEQGVNDKLEDLKHWDRVYGWIISDITTNIALVEDKKIPEGQNIDEYIKSSVDTWNSQIAQCNNNIEYYNKQLDKAKYQLDLYQGNESTVLPNPENIALEVATANLNAAQEKLEFLKNRADELQAQYEAATKQQ